MRADELLESRVAGLGQPTHNRIAWARVRDYWEECEKTNDAGYRKFEDWPCKDLAYSAEVMDAETTARAVDHGSTKRISPREADQIIASSDMLSRMADRQPEIVTGPVDTARQFWVATRKPRWRAPVIAKPMQPEFRWVTESRTLYAKPRKGGLFTSTGACGKPGMWRIYLYLNDSSTLHGKPWHTWRLEVEDHVSIREITCAEDWVSFVQAYSISIDGAVHPDRRKAAEEHDGIHLTLRAVAAIDGIELECTDGVITPSAWGTETTLWLRWRFTGQSLVESTA